MSTSHQSWSCSESPLASAGAAVAATESWFALHTRARHEKVVAQRIGDKGLVTFLPLVKGVHRWSDRSKIIESPLFSCYVFAKLASRNDERLRVLLVEGVLGFVGPRGQGIAIPEEQIESVRRLVQEKLPYCSHPFLKIGQRVRIRSGALLGVEGILVSRCGKRNLVVSVDAIDRSLAISIEGYDVEPV